MDPIHNLSIFVLRRRGLGGLRKTIPHDKPIIVNSNEPGRLGPIDLPHLISMPTIIIPRTAGPK